MELSELKASTRSKADEESTGYVSDTALLRFINEGNRFLYNKVVAACEDYFIVEGDTDNDGLISVTSGTRKYPLPATMQKLVLVEWRIDGDTSDDDWMPMDRVGLADRRRLNAAYYPPREGYPNGNIGFYTAGQYIFFRPVPKAAFDAKLWFIPRAVNMVDETDVPDAPEEFHELICDFAAMRILGKSGESIFAELKDLFSVQMQVFLETVGHRVYEPEQMTIYEDEGY